MKPWMGRVFSYGLALLLGLVAMGSASAQEPSTARQALDRFLKTELDPAQCYRVRDLFLEREDVKFYFTDGLLIFAKPFDGRDVAALFLASEQGDFGEMLVIPPTPRERRSVALFTKEAVLDERFRSALMLFTDDTADRLRAEIENGPAHKLDSDSGAMVAPRWTPVLQNILSGVSLRMLADLISDRPVEQGVFAAAVNGGRLGRFDVVVDPHLREQVSIGQSVRREGRSFYNVWAQFESRSVRQNQAQQSEINASLEDYRIEVELGGPSLAMKAVVEADLVPSEHSSRTFAFELSENLRLESLLVDGEPADYVQLEQSPAGGASRRQNNVVLLALESEPATDDRPRLRFVYSGEAVADAGQRVFMVMNRGDWYPRGEPGFAEYDMTFRHPSQFDLVATGELVSETIADGVREVRFRSPSPIRLAGFNIGDYVATSRQVDGYTVEIRANRRAESRLKPKAPLPVLVPKMGGRRNRTLSGESTIMTPAETPPPDPAARIEEIADEDAAAFGLFLERFGPPVTPRVVVSPIPAGFGQGFPGLVYAATLSYFAVGDAPLKNLDPVDQQFYAEMLRAHEISHQWWGNSVTVSSSSDNWLMEGLATYSAMLNMERRKGPQSFSLMLEQFQRRLLAENDEGLTMESAGPVTLGDRLRTARFPGAYRIITYDKSAWALHMLRSRLGDEGFFELLAKLVRDYRLKEISTEAFRREAAAFVPEGSPDPELRDFFDQWIYDVGLPRFSVDFDQNASGGGFVLEGVLEMGDVDPAFLTPVELEAAMADGKTQRITVWTDGPETEFEMKLPAKAQRITIDPDRRLLAVRKP